MRKLLPLIGIVLIIVGLIRLGWEYLPGFSERFSSLPTLPSLNGNSTVKVLQEESVVIDVVKKATPSVVTIARDE